MAYEATTNLGLQKAVPGSNQAFETSVFNDNWDAVDGVFPLESANLADGAVTSGKLAAGAVTGAKIADGEVSAAKLASDSVTTAKLADANVTKVKLASDVTSFFAPLDSPTFTTNVRVPAKVQFANDDYISFDDTSNEFSFDRDMTSGGTAGNAGVAVAYLKVGGRRVWIQADDPGVDAVAGDLWIDLP